MKVLGAIIIRFHVEYVESVLVTALFPYLSIVQFYSLRIYKYFRGISRTELMLLFLFHGYLKFIP